MDTQEAIEFLNLFRGKGRERKIQWEVDIKVD